MEKRIRKKKVEMGFWKGVNHLCKIKGGWFFLFILLISSIVTAVSLIGISLVLQEFINIATGVSEFTTAQIFIFAGFIVLIYAAGMVLSTVFETVYTNRTEKKIRLMLMRHTADTKQRFADTYHSSDILTRLTVDTERITNFLPNIFGQLASEILPSVLALVTMLIMNWKMALIMLSVVPCIIIVISLLSPKQQSIAQKDIANEETNRSGTLIAMVQLTNYVLMPINTLSGWIKKFNECKVSLNRMEEVLKLPVYQDDKVQSESDKQYTSLVVENLKFQYNDNGPLILSGVNATFFSGVNCIVGESGSGGCVKIRPS